MPVITIEAGKLNKEQKDRWSLNLPHQLQP